MVRNQLLGGKPAPKRVNTNDGTPKPRNFASSAKRRYAQRRGLHTSLSKYYHNYEDETTISLTNVPHDSETKLMLSLEETSSTMSEADKAQLISATIEMRKFCHDYLCENGEDPDLLFMDELEDGCKGAAALLKVLEDALKEHLEVSDDLDEAVEHWLEEHGEEVKSMSNARETLADRFEEVVLLTFIRAEKDEVLPEDMLALIAAFKKEHS